MKTRILMTTLVSLLTMAVSAQSLSTPDLDRVTIFSNGAQVYRHKTVSLQPGEQTISFTGISPYIDINSLQVKAKGRVTILGMSHRFIIPDSIMVTGKVRQAEAELKRANHQMEELKASRAVLQSQLEMVKTNCSTANRTVATPLEGIKQLNNYYYDEMMAINKRIIALNDEEERAALNVSKRQQTLDSLTGIKVRRLTVVNVKVDVPQATRADFLFSYYLSGASWFPSYELRSNSTKEPLQLIYKAAITQQTHEDWRNATVTLSSGNPNRSNVSPDLKTYWLDYGLAAPTYEFGIDNNKVSGMITDSDGEPLVGATIQVKGTTIGTVSNVDGQYNLTLPNNNRQLEASYIGMVSQLKTATGNRLNFRLENDNVALEEVVVTGFGTPKGGARVKQEQQEMAQPKRVKAKRVDDDNSMEVASTAAKFGYEFAIGHPLTILSDNKPVNCQIGNYELPATYAYKSVPKIDKDAFLVADATGWNELNLTEGEASVFFDNSYVGKTTLNPNQQSDTLHISMGRDNGIKIDRKLVKNNTRRKFLGSSTVQTTDWEISVRNTREEQVTINIYDQIPVSRNSEITVTATQLSGGELDKDNGQVVWTLQLAPGETRKLNLIYEVKHAKNRHLVIE